MREEEEKRRKEKKRKEKGKVSSNSEIPSRTNLLSLSPSLLYPDSIHHLQASSQKSVHLPLISSPPDCRHHLLFSHPIPHLPVARQKMKKKKEVPYHSPSLEKTSPEVVVNILSMITWR